MQPKPFPIAFSQLYSLLAFSLSSFLSVSSVAIAQTNSTQSCQAAVTAATNRLEAVGNLEVTVRKSDISDAAYPDRPSGRSEAYSFAMKGTALESVMRSKVLLTDLATRMIQSCDAVGMVSFGQASSGWHLPFGIFADGQIKAFECAEDYDGLGNGPRNYGSLRWGLFYCSL